MNNILAVIPARGGSKGIPKKNLIKLNNKSLIQIAIQEAKKSKYISDIVFSSDDEKIIKEAKKFIKVYFERPKKYASDVASSYDVARHALDYYEKKFKKRVDFIVILSPTSPFRTAKIIDSAIKKITKSKKFDSLVGITEVDYPPFWMLVKNKNSKIDWLMKNEKKFNTRQEFPKIYQPNGMIYIIRRNKLLTMKGILPQKKTLGHFISKQISINIDNIDQYNYAKYKFKLKK
jgi:CMP-N,N'-diacetyllegionaminic acid synthase